MKKILLVNQDQEFIGDLQMKFARNFEILATEDFATAFRLLKNIPFDLMLARLPPTPEQTKTAQLKKLLKKLQRKKFAQLTKILIAPEGGDYQIDDYLKLGIAAVVVDVEGAAKWMD